MTFSFPGGIKTSCSETFESDSLNSSSSPVIGQDNVTESDEGEGLGRIPVPGPSSQQNCNVETNSEVTGKSCEGDAHDRRKKISKFLSEQKDKKMNPRISSENYQLHYMKEDISLKRKLHERVEAMDEEFLEHTKKNSRIMETMSNAMTKFLQVWTTMMQAQVQQQNVYNRAPQAAMAFPSMSYAHHPDPHVQNMSHSNNFPHHQRLHSSSDQSEGSFLTMLD